MCTKYARLALLNWNPHTHTLNCLMWPKGRYCHLRVLCEYTRAQIFANILNGTIII